MDTKHCPKCSNKYKDEQKKETVSLLMDQPTAAVDYRMKYCPVCKYREFYKIEC